MTAVPVCETDGQPCNNTGGHRRHRRRGDDPCAACLAALRSYQAARRRHPDHRAARAEPAAAARFAIREDARRRRRQELVTISLQDPAVAAQLAARDGDWCAWCRSGPLLAADRPHSLDHDVPLSRGGADHLDNLRLTCPTCNTAKGVLTGAEFLAHRRTTRPVTWPAQRLTR